MKPVYNKQANFNFEILNKYQAGLVLAGHEAKSIKEGQINLKGAYVSIRQNPKSELFLINAHISKYKPAGSLPNYDPIRPRKLLLQKNEIKSLVGKLEQKGLTLVPIRVYTNRNLVKLEFGLAKGKKKFEKRDDKKKKDVQRELHRTLKNQY